MLGVTGVLFYVVQCSTAAVVTEYDFTGNSAVPTTVATPLTANNFGVGSGVTLSLGSNQASARVFDTANFAAAVTAGDFFTFTNTAPTGNFDISDFSFQELVNAQGPLMFEVTINGTPITAATATNGSLTTHTYSSLGLTGLTSATIDIVAWDPSGPSNGTPANWMVDTVIVSGTVHATTASAPEASSLAIWSVLGLSIAGIRAWRRK
jgi:hypothetical protein